MTKETHNALHPVAWLRIIYRNGDVKTMGYGSKAAQMDAYQHLIGHPKVEHVETHSTDPDDKWRSVGDVTKNIIEGLKA